MVTPPIPSLGLCVGLWLLGLGEVSAAVSFESEVKPIFEKHCVECHGPKKQKGRLRLDTLAAAKKSGSGGEPALVPGDAEASELMRRIGLPREDEEAMPPGERDALSAAEKGELAAWIAGLAK